MIYLLICEHGRTIVEASHAGQARQMLPCKRCKVFDLQGEKWQYKDVRIYPATPEDIKAGSTTQGPMTRRKGEPIEQLDWVGKRADHD